MRLAAQSGPFPEPDSFRDQIPSSATVVIFEDVVERAADGGDARLMATTRATSACPATACAQPRARQCGVQFGDVQVLHHAIGLDDSKLPSDGLAPIGLGRLQCREEVRRARASFEPGAYVIPTNRSAHHLPA